MSDFPKSKFFRWGEGHRVAFKEFAFLMIPSASSEPNVLDKLSNGLDLATCLLLQEVLLAFSPTSRSLVSSAYLQVMMGQTIRQSLVPSFIMWGTKSASYKLNNLCRYGISTPAPLAYSLVRTDVSILANKLLLPRPICWSLDRISSAWVAAASIPSETSELRWSYTWWNSGNVGSESP